MQITIFGATGAVGSECLRQALQAGHQVTVLVRTASRIATGLRQKIVVVEGDVLNTADVGRALNPQTAAVLFAIGVDKHSPQDLCTDATRNILESMRDSGIRRFVWCGGGSTLVAEDQVTLGARMVEKIAALFMSLKHVDKEHQYQLLDQSRDIDWIGVRPLQMRKGPQTGQYRLGFTTFNAMSWISFADCADAMVQMLDDNTWLGKAPILQY
jgi:putative NADH-flavin reductase